MEKFNCKKIISTVIISQLLLPLCVLAKDVYQTPGKFLAEVFSGAPPKPEKLWIRKDLKRQMREILQHDPGVLRMRFWEKDGRTAWVLEETGKVKPITTGVVVKDSKVELIRVLAFRESRGGEVRYPFFTEQFRDAALTEAMELNKPIDGISGATLSVRALIKQARLSLLLHEYSQAKKKR
ncbi:MAG: FMN-binding protein [Gammaproteobacteria bacterium]